MQSIPSHIRHSRGAFSIAISFILERAAYYGLRALLVLFLVNGNWNLPDADAAVIYSNFVTTIIFMGIVGALIGDLLLGNKRAIIVGGILECLGIFCMLLPSLIGIYIGLGLISLGSGLFRPNLLARFGKLYQKKTQLLDGGYSMINVATNIGAFIGTTVIVFLGELNFAWGFGIAGICMIGAIVLMTMNTEKPSVASKKIGSKFNKKFIYIAGAAGIMMISYFAQELGSILFRQIGRAPNGRLDLGMMLYLPQLVGSGAGLILGIILAIVWSRKYSNSFTKLAIGLILGFFAFGLMFSVMGNFSSDYLIPILTISALCAAGMELFVYPIANSIAAAHSNPKYLATILSLLALPISLASLFYEFWVFESEKNLQWSFGIFLFITAALIVGFFFTRSFWKEKPIFEEENMDIIDKIGQR